MPFRIARLARLLLPLLVALLLLPGRAGAQAPGVAALDPAKATLDRIELAIQYEGLSEEAYADLKRQLVPLRDELRDKIEALTPQLAQATTRLNQIGDKPGTAPEDPALTAERAKLTAQHAEIDAALKQARLLALRADEIGVRINEQRRALIARELFTRTAGVLDTVFWRTTLDELAEEMKSLGVLLGGWWEHMRRHYGLGRLAATTLLLVALAVVLRMLRRWWRRRFGVPTQPTRFARSSSALMVMIGHALGAPLAVAAAVAAIESYGLMPSQVAEIGYGLAVAVGIAGFSRGVAVALFAPGQPERRLVRCGEVEAGVLTGHLTWAARLLALAVFVNIMHKGIAAPISLTLATSALVALAFVLLAIHLLLRFPRPVGEGEGVHLGWLRAVAWAFIAAVGVALVTGYIGFAAFLAGRVLAVVVLLGALYVANGFVGALFDEELTADTERGRAAAALLGIAPRTLELAGTLVSVLLRAVLVLLAIIPVIGRWGLIDADVSGVVQSASSFRIGDITVSITAIVAAVVIFLVGILATRGAQRWLERRFLPRTGLDPGLQHSVSALMGYALLIAVVSLALARLGLDLQKIAIVAGALSVGIGFGLQSVVSNFVSGLILLAERPIRVGDWVVVKSEEGWVRRISVRATEIETFDRATVIVPNSEFITGVVKNWTHSNTMGRTVVKVGVAYDSDPEQVRELLLACAREHPQVLQTPPPRVFLLGFGDSALEFELRCIVADVENMLMVKSDLHFAVLASFRAAGIAIPFPQREVRLLADREGETAGKTTRGEG